jgi:N-methylhydantoinase A
VEFISFKVRAGLPERLLKLLELPESHHTLSDAVKGERQAFSGVAKSFVSHTVYDRYKLNNGASFRGPAIIEERESTVIVGEDASVSVDKYGFLWIELDSRE